MPSAVVKDGTNLRAASETDAERAASASAERALVDVNGFLGGPGTCGTKQQIQDELDSMAAFVRRFHLLPADQVMRYCGAFTARLTELYVQLHRVESLDRQYTRVRTQQVEKWLEELERQMKIASRMIEVQRLDYESTRGA